MELIDLINYLLIDNFWHNTFSDLVNEIEPEVLNDAIKSGKK